MKENESKNDFESFTCFAKFGESCANLSQKDKEKMGAAIFMFGMFGVEIELKNSLKALFVLMKDDIEYSKVARSSGSKGGRKPKPMVSENEKPMVSEKEEQKTEASTEQYRTVQNSSKEKESKPKKRFAKPSVEDVREYANSIGYPQLDAQYFVDYYESNGWMRGNTHMKDWKATVRTWKGKEVKKGGERNAEPSEYDDLFRYPEEDT